MELVLFNGEVHDEVTLDIRSPLMMAVPNTGDSIRTGRAVKFDSLGGRTGESIQVTDLGGNRLVGDFERNKESVGGQRQHADW